MDAEHFVDGYRKWKEQLLAASLYLVVWQVAANNNYFDVKQFDDNLLYAEGDCYSTIEESAYLLDPSLISTCLLRFASNR